MRAGWELFRCWLANQVEVTAGSEVGLYAITGTDLLLNNGERKAREWVLGPVGVNEDGEPQAMVDLMDRKNPVSALLGSSLFVGQQDYGNTTVNAALTQTIVAGGDPTGQKRLSMPQSYLAIERVGEIVHRFPDPDSWEGLPQAWPNSGWPSDCQPADHEIVDQAWSIGAITGGAESLYLDDDNYYLEVSYTMSLTRV